jgi:hypothetical protein
MPKTRGTLCDRVLRMLNKTDGDAPASAGDIQVVNGLLEPTAERLARQGLIYVIDFGNPDDLNSGAIPNSLFLGLAQVLTLAAAPDFGAPIDTYTAVAQLGEQALASVRYKADRASNPTPPPQGSRGDLCQRTLKMIKIINEGDIATDEAVQVVNRLIGPAMRELGRRNVVYVSNLGNAADLTSGNIPDSEIDALTQILSRQAALQFGPPYFTGNVADYIQLATEGEQRLRAMRRTEDTDEPIRACYF